MKRNDPYNWTITLRGKTRTKTLSFVGRLDEALAEADEQESGVAFTVLEYVVTRGKRVLANDQGVGPATGAARRNSED